MSTAPGRIMGKLSVKTLTKKLSGRVADHPDKTRAISAVRILFPGPDMQGVEHRQVRALDPTELKRTDPLRASSSLSHGVKSQIAICGCRRRGSLGMLAP
jgi:hypothetical protein